jgi:hypothetical protein
LVWFDEAGRHLESLETEMSVGEQMLTQFHRTVTSLVRRRNDLDDAFRAASVLYAADAARPKAARLTVTAIEAAECQPADLTDKPLSVKTLDKAGQATNDPPINAGPSDIMS